VDGDGVSYRTVLGNQHPSAAWFSRGTGHDENTRYSEDNVVWETLANRLKKKYETARSHVPLPVVTSHRGASVGIIAYGSSDPAVEEARAILSRENGLKSAYLRLRALPWTREVLKFIGKYDRIYIVEGNRDGQLRQVLSADMPGHATRFISIAHSDGLPLTAAWIVGKILEQEVK